MSKIALVTGGSRGIGFGIAEKLAAEKWDVIINGVRPEEAVAESLTKLRAHGIRGCAAEMAYEYGEQPEGSVERMRCALELVNTLYRQR